MPVGIRFYDSHNRRTAGVGDAADIILEGYQVNFGPCGIFSRHIHARSIPEFFTAEKEKRLYGSLCSW
jgi:hypothetical protein